jgi:hypothetical protein
MFEEHSRWRGELCSAILALCQQLDVAHTASDTNSKYYFPIVNILEEIEDISSILFIVGAPVPRGWFIDACLLKLPVPYEVIMEAYISLFEKWIGRGAEKLLISLSSAVFILKHWILSVQ